MLFDSFVTCDNEATTVKPNTKCHFPVPFVTA